MIVTCPACGRKAAVDETVTDVKCDCGRRFDPAARPTVADPFLGRTIHGYRIDEVLGSGGMGTVYKATQLSLSRTVAIKVLPTNVADDPHFVARFHREAEILASLSHPNIVQVIDRGEWEGRWYIAMEYVPGTSLRELVRQGPVPPNQAYKIVASLLEALDYAHARGVIHRDIKPENVLITHGGVVKVADFGLGRVLGADDFASRLTHTYLILGTFEYMSPEQREAIQDADQRSDIYATAVVLYEMLTGELPIGRFELPGKKLARVDRRIDAILEKGLAKDRDKRYARASAMAKDLEGLLSAPPGAPVDLDAIKQAVGAGVEKVQATVKQAVRNVNLDKLKVQKGPTSFEARLDLLLTVLGIVSIVCMVLGAGLLVAGERVDLGLIDLRDDDWAGAVVMVWGILLRIAVDGTRKFRQGARTSLLTLTAVAAPTIFGLPFMAWTWWVLLSPSMRIYFDGRRRGLDTFEAARLAHGIALDPGPRPEVERRKRAAATSNQRAALVLGAVALAFMIVWLAILADSDSKAFKDEGAFFLVSLVLLGPLAVSFALLGERVRQGEWLRLNGWVWTALSPIAPAASSRARMLARDARDGIA